MGDDMDRRRVGEEPIAHARYDPGPSGTAVAGLIIGLIALAVALYAAFAPRDTVRQGAQAVTAQWEQATDGSQERKEARVDDKQGAKQEQSQDDGISLAQVQNELRQQTASLRSELGELRAQLGSGGPQGNGSSSGGQAKSGAANPNQGGQASR